ncbi:M20 family metallopeptidase [Candidatus Absconditicoccus praedator]|uniref:M20 family metallopeptidase n=1 Tax=Candidatus Absconditicoccus praedator TaxID=2735562 RepID=UPI001E4DD106|nr:M20/M25/M40 family metallo-hydrolase [Candidatus Absconditicoccus praedator]UFX82560.1 M20/M25/M40 family metallo-hydrolase [Candidatus Absconditicoccus praedator]
MIEVLKTLQSIKSIDGKENEKKRVCDYVHSLFENTGFYIERFENEGIYSIVISSKGGRDTDFLFCGHLDVVDADEQTWEFDEDEEFYYGRGTLDMKGSCAVMINVFLDNQKNILNSNKNFALMFTTDEEIGSSRGVNYLINTIGFNADMVYIPDTGAGMNRFLREGKGFLFTEIKISGVESHGCRPWRGKTALDTFVGLYNNLYEIFPRAKGDEDGWFATSVNIGIINGGEAFNKVMGNLTFNLDIRFHPKNSLEEIENKLYSIVDKFENVECNLLHRFGGFSIDDQSEYIKKISGCGSGLLWSRNRGGKRILIQGLKIFCIFDK